MPLGLGRGLWEELSLELGEIDSFGKVFTEHFLYLAGRMGSGFLTGVFKSWKR